MAARNNHRIATEKKLELVRSIRKTQEDNLATLNKREAILFGKPISYRNGNKYEKERITGKESGEVSDEDFLNGRKPILTFKVRVFLSILLLCGYFTFMTVTENQFALEKAMVKTYITKDFTNNLFAFMEDITYTLDYEKTSAE